MKILNVKIKNLNSLRLATSVDFTSPPLGDVGLFAITGDTGSGKTTLLDAITLAMYGRVHRNKQVKDVMTYGTTDSYAEVQFSSRGELYLSKWSIRKARQKIDGNILGPDREISKFNPKTKTFDILAEKIREVDRSIEEITGLDYDRFTRSVLLSQGDFAAFLKANEKDRSDLLERITGTEIYSNISKAAFQKYREEEAKLKEMRSNLESLKILDKQDVKILKANLKEVKKERKEVKKEVNKSREKIDWLKQLEQLKKENNKISANLALIKEETENFDFHLNKLQLFKKARPHLSLLNETERLKETVQSNQFTLDSLNEKLPDLIQKENQFKEQLSTHKSALQISKTEQKEESKIFDQVLKLDVKIKEKEEPLQKLVEEIQVQKDKNEQRLKEKKQLNENLTTFHNTITKTDHWLKENKQLKQLKDDLPKIEHHLGFLRNFWVENNNLFKDLKETEKQRNLSKTAKEKIEKQIEKQKHNIENAKLSFKKSAPDHFVLDRNEMLLQLNEEIDQLNKQGKHLEQLKNIQNEYDSLLKEYNAYEDQLDHLIHHRFELRKELMTASDVLHQTQQQLDYKQEIYNQQQLISNYERDRKTLKEDEACPLCFSTSHPFRKHSIKPFVDRAKKEYDQIKKQHESVSSNYKKLNNQNNEIEIQISNIIGEREDKVEGQLYNIQSKVLQYEQKFALIAPELSIENYAASNSAAILKKVNDFENILSQKKDTRDQLIESNKQIKAQEELLHSLDQKFKEENIVYIKLQSQVENTQEKINKQNLESTESETKLNLLLHPFDLNFSIENPIKGLDIQLHNSYKEFENNSTLKTETEQSLKLDEQKLNQLLKSIEEESTGLEKKTNQFEKDKKTFNDLKEKRFKLFEDKDPVGEKEKWIQKIQNQETTLEEIKNNLQIATLLLTTNSHSIKTKNEELKKNSSNYEKRSLQLLKKIVALGFEDLNTFHAVLLSEEEAQKIESQENTLTKKRVATEQSKKDITTKINKETTKQLTTKTIQEIETQFTEKDEKLQSLTREEGALNQRLNENEEKKAASKTLLDSIEKQRKEFNRWAKLNDIIGAADGKKFRIFAQGLTLKKLVMLANQHLQNLNGRYHIEKRSDEDLELDIIDTFQANNKRSMMTLSGGESFLASLSLALGLSDLAGRNTSIQTLFIDEGFGTLDDASLDMAISTLENLQASGKTIGIISHIKELKERISTQIQIVKTGNGFSEIQVV